jgi:demethylmenaquinone methyltransferase/2-methoxy-6-polyprenyl-1,4-benzoquinol methylase
MIRKMFDSIAPRYDLLNRLLSFRRDTSWRKWAVDKVLIDKKGAYLDVATGTADVALEIKRQAPLSRVVALDFASRMLDLARKKVVGKGIDLVRGDALRMPFPDNAFDGAIVAYGVRNFPDRFLGLQEMRRVVKPQGRVVILEFSTPPSIGGMAYETYLSRFLPWMGGLVSGNPKAYRYLHDSVEAFPPTQAFCDMMVHAKLARIRYYPLTLGITICYVGEKER